VITKAVLKLAPNPNSQAVALCGLKSFDEVANFLVHAQSSLGSNLSAFEVLWNNTYHLIDEYVPSVTVPLAKSHGFYVLVESMGSNAERDLELFLDSLNQASDQKLIDEVVVADSDTKIRNIWAVRDGAAEVIGAGYMHAYDVSLNIDAMGYFGEEVEKRIRAKWSDTVIGLFGHIGDGNVHIIVNVGPETRNVHLDIDEIVYTLIQELNGSISAEHGIGTMKKQFLDCSKSEPEISLMKSLKQTMDPHGILSPGRIF